MRSDAATNTSRRRLLTGTVGAATIAALSGCARLTRRSAPLTIGVLLPRSGYLGQSGDACYEGMLLAHDLLGQMGLPPFRTLEGDTGESLDTAVKAAEHMIEDGAQLLIGCFDSGQTVEVAAVAERRRVPMVINIAAAPSISEQGYRYVFRNFPDALRIVSEGVNLLKGPNLGLLLITHYQRILNYIKPQFVHVLVNGSIIQSGGPELALELEQSGYENLVK